MKVLIDTNILIDYITNREPYATNAYRIIELCVMKTVEGGIAAHSVMNLFYILRKDLSVDERRETLKKFCRVFTVVGIDNSKIMSALENENFMDFEDCLQDECAKDFQADYIITRNIKDFSSGYTKAIDPCEFLASLTV